MLVPSHLFYSSVSVSHDSEPACTIKAAVRFLLSPAKMSPVKMSVYSPFPCRPFSRRLPCLLCSKWCPCPFPCPCPLPLRVPRRSFSRAWDGFFILIRTLSLSLPGPISSLTGLKLSRPVPSSSGLDKGCRGLWESSPALAARGPPCPPRSLL